MTAELLASITGIVVSLLFSYVPGLSDWFDGLQSNIKRLIMLAALFLTAAGIFGLACTGLFNIDVACNVSGAIGMLELFILAAIGNQTAYALSPK